MTGADKHQPLLSAASSISDGDAVDWQEVRRQLADELDTAVLEELQILDGIAQVHRTEWGTLELLEPIGHGAFGTVYRAFDHDLQRHVALKVTRPAANGAAFDPERLVQEARRLARVKHPNVVSVFSAERKGNEVGVVMEWLKGQTLDAIVHAQGPLGAREVALIGIDVCRALAAVHAAGLLHGDIKAHNVMREDGGRIVLMDFGASRDLSRPPGLGGDFAGTPVYVAPEVFAGAPRSTASDVYSLGVLLYYLSTGRYPVDGDTRSALDRQHAPTTGRHHLRDVRPDLPDGFVHVVERAIAESPADRYPTVGSMEAALTSLLAEGAIPSRTPRRRTILMLAAIVALTAAVAVLLDFREQTGATDQPNGSRGETLSTVAIATPALATVVNAAPAPYDVEAAVYRMDRTGPVRLSAGERVHPGNRLFLEVKASIATHVYVIDEDDMGDAHLLFPLSGYAEANPLAGGQPHRLPGPRGGIEYYWQATTAGGREHFLIFVSPEKPLTQFEKDLVTMPRASEDTPVSSLPIGLNALNTLRGIGGIAAATTPRRDQPLYKQYQTPLPATSETTTGTWIRQLTLTSTP